LLGYAGLLVIQIGMCSLLTYHFDLFCMISNNVKLYHHIYLGGWTSTNPSYFGVQRMKRICHWIFTQLHPVAKWDIKTVCWGPACVSKVDHDMLWSSMINILKNTDQLGSTWDSLMIKDKV
jgi:hypothetical protein